MRPVFHSECTYATLGFERQNQHSPAISVVQVRSSLRGVSKILTANFFLWCFLFWSSLCLCNMAILNKMFFTPTRTADISRRRFATTCITRCMFFRAVPYKMPRLNSGKHNEQSSRADAANDLLGYRFCKHSRQVVCFFRDIHL